MEDSRALSPEVKSLFKIVEGQVKDYNTAFELLVKELKALANEKQSVLQTTQTMVEKVENSLTNLQEVHDAAIKELDETTQKALSLHNELEQVQRIRVDLEERSRVIIQYIQELQSAINDFKYKSDKEITQSLKKIEELSEDALEKESQKIEVRLSMKNKQIEQKIGTIEQKLFQVGEGTKKDMRMMLMEFDDVKSDTNRLKQITDELNQAILMQGEESEIDVERKFKLLDKQINELSVKFKELEERKPQSGGGDSDDPFGDLPASNLGGLGDIASKLKAKSGGSSSSLASAGGNIDNSYLAKDIKSLALKIDQINAESEAIVDRASSTEKKGNLALYFAGASLVGIIILFIILLSK